jgi:hypothetical protein
MGGRAPVGLPLILAGLNQYRRDDLRIAGPIKYSKGENRKK